VFEQLFSLIDWRVMAFSQIGLGYLTFYQNLGYSAIISDPEMLKS